VQAKSIYAMAAVNGMGDAVPAKTEEGKKRSAMNGFVPRKAKPKGLIKHYFQTDVIM